MCLAMAALEMQTFLALVWLDLSTKANTLYYGDFKYNTINDLEDYDGL
jgi:hypothetical protein